MVAHERKQREREEREKTKKPHVRFYANFENR
jgi:hypothetical protein